MTFSRLKELIFHSKENPEGLAKVIYGLAHPTNMTADLELADVKARIGATLASVKATLPTKINLSLGGFNEELTITWGTTTTPSYNANAAGEYVLSGTLSGLPTYLTNTGNKVVNVTIAIEAYTDAALTSISLGTTNPVVCNHFVESATAGEFTGVMTISAAQAAIGQAFALVTHDTPATVSTTGLATGAVTTKTGTIADAAISDKGTVVVTVTAEDGTTTKKYTITVTVTA